MNNKKKKIRQDNINLHQTCIERIEKMYEDNKNFYKLYQEILQKNIILENELKNKTEYINILEDEIKEIKEEVINLNNKLSLINNNIEKDNSQDINIDEDYKMEIYCEDCNKIIKDDKYIEFGAFTYCYECDKTNKEMEDLDNISDKNSNEPDTPLPSPSNSFPINIDKNDNNDNIDTAVKPAKKKIQKSRNKDLPILERFGIKAFDDNDIKNSEILKLVSEEDCFNIEYQHLVACKLNKKDENITIDDVVDFKIKYEKKRNTNTRRKEYRYLIKRCTFLFGKYDKNLGKFKIPLYNLRSMSDDEWEEFKIEFDKLYTEIFKNSIKCNSILKSGRNKGNPCNRLNCNIKHND